MNKKILLFLSSILCLVTFAFSQNVGIGTNNPQNKLHVAGGLRVDTLVGVGGAGILIHNSVGAVYGLKFSGDVNDVLRGDGTFGASGSGSPSNVWKLSGNSGTDFTNFIGTTDATPFFFRIQNGSSGFIKSDETAFGIGALLQSTLTVGGHHNTAIGEYSLQANIEGVYNTAVGSFALYSNDSQTGSLKGNYNTATGSFALYLNGGSYNTATGVQSLNTNNSGDYNTATGYYSLYSNSTGTDNTAVGALVLDGNSTGSYNTGVGVLALSGNTANGNTAIGYEALSGNSSGASNTATGDHALIGIESGSANTADGESTLYHTSDSWYNTALGYHAGFSKNNGYNNVFVGANTDVNDNYYFNVIAIGQGTICTNSSQVTMGNSATTVYRAYANWSNISDGRYKKNLKEDVPGLAFIQKLRPVTYTLDASALDNFLHKNLSKKNEMNAAAKSSMDKALKEKEQIRLTGFVAQEVEQSAKELGFDFSGIDTPKNQNDVYGLRYAEFVVPLVKAVQEQQQQIEELKKQNEILLKRIEKLESSSYTNK